MKQGVMQRIKGGNQVLKKAVTWMLCLVLLLAAAFSTGGETAYAATQDASLGALHVKGSHLCDKNGKVVQLRGVSTHGLSWFPGYVNDACVGELHDKWKANTLRLAMYTAEYNGYCTGDDNNRKQLRELVKNGVKYAKKHKMYAIVDWHILSDGDPMTNVAEAEKFWKTMSKDLASYDNVLYEICNEPNGWSGNWEQIKAYANRVIPIIRKNDADSVIIVGTPTWSQEVDKAVADPLPYKNLLYTLHFYAGTHQQYLRDVAEAAIKKGLPIMVTEFGICDASGNGALNIEEGNRWISFLDKYQVGYVAWNLSNKAESSSLINSYCNKTSGFAKSDLSESGQWFYDLLRKHAESKPGQATKKKATIKVKKTSFSTTKKSIKKKDKTFSPDVSVNSKGKLTFKKLSGSRYLSVTKEGKVKLKAKTPKGSYRIKIKVKAASTKKYTAKSMDITIKVKVK